MIFSARVENKANIENVYIKKCIENIDICDKINKITQKCDNVFKRERAEESAFREEKIHD